jgi:thiamine biosynthesis lipoprotein
MHSIIRVPDPAELAKARSSVGMGLVQLNPKDFTVRFEREGVMLDLGAVGKGYAIEQAVQILRDDGIEHALIHGGTSTVYALGHQEDGRPWKIAIEAPSEHENHSPTLLAAIPLREQALSVSAVWGRSFTANNRNYGHVLDPRTGSPCERARMAVVITESATEADALSTALLVQGTEGLESLARERPALRGLVLAPEGCQTRGIELV